MQKDTHVQHTCTYTHVQRETVVMPIGTRATPRASRGKSVGALNLYLWHCSQPSFL